MTEVCKRSDGLFRGPAYPSLMALWSLDLDIPEKEIMSMAFPIGEFPLKVKAEICFRQDLRRNGGDSASLQYKGVCCADSNQSQDAEGSCQGCLGGSSPRLNGFFCESCPIGFEPRGG